MDDRPAHAGALRRRRRAGAVSLAGCRAQRAGRRQGVEFNARVGGKQHAESLQQGSLQLTMDGIFARLDLAYGYHASTCEVANRTLAFFARAAGGAGG